MLKFHLLFHTLQALRFFQTHQIRINLKRHPSIAPTPTKASAGGGSGNSGREWRHGRGTIKVDPLTSVEKIERYLVERGKLLKFKAL